MMADPEYCRSIVSLAASSKEGGAAILVPSSVMRDAKAGHDAWRSKPEVLKWIACIGIVAAAAFAFAVYSAGRGAELGSACGLFAGFAALCLSWSWILDWKPGRISLTAMVVACAALLWFGSKEIGIDLLLAVTVIGGLPLCWLVGDAKANASKSLGIGPAALYGDRFETIYGDQSVPRSFHLDATDEVRTVVTKGGVWMHLVGRDGNVRLSLLDYRVCDMDLNDTGVDPREAFVSRMRAL